MKSKNVLSSFLVSLILATGIIFASLCLVSAAVVPGMPSTTTDNNCNGFEGLGMSFGCDHASACCTSASLYPSTSRGTFKLISTSVIGPATNVQITGYRIDDGVIVKVTSNDYTGAPAFIGRVENGHFVARTGTTNELINGISGGCTSTANQPGQDLNKQSISIPLSYFSSTGDNTIEVYGCKVGSTISDHWVRIEYTPAGNGGGGNGGGSDANFPTGYLDALTCSSISGWTCDLDSPSTQLALHLYDGASFLTAIPSSLTGDSRPDVAAAGFCAGNANHGFNVAFPAFLKDNQPHSVRVYAIGTPDNNKNTNLDSPAGVNGATLTCAPVCGDGFCGGGETSASCASDCGPAPVCGDGICNGNENAGTCAQDCAAPGVCGDSLIGFGEQCDGLNLNGQTCQSQGFLFGNLGCTNACTLNTAGCSNVAGPICGNNIIEAPEVCDGTSLGGQTCQSLGYTSGTLGCTNACGFNQNQCVATNNTLVINNVVTNPTFPIANNGSTQPVTVTFNSSMFPIRVTFNLYNAAGLVNTQGPITVVSPAGLPVTYTIPGNLLNGVYSLNMTVMNNFGNTVTINLGTITVNNIVPPLCGNGLINAGETCDGSNLNGQTCLNFDTFTGGTLQCDQSCQISTLQCNGGTPPGFCGDGLVNPGETCDGNNFGIQSCQMFGFTGGQLTCGSCQISTTQCTGGQGGNQTNQTGNLFLTVISPLPITYNSQSILVNLVSNGTTIWFTSNAGVTNTTYTSPVFVNFSNGLNVFTAYARNAAGTVVSYTVPFIVSTGSNGNNQTNSSSGGSGGGSNKNKGSIINQLSDTGATMEDGSVLVEEESDSGKKLPEKSLFAGIFKNVSWILLLLILLILFLILLILLASGKKTKNKEQPSNVPNKKK